MGLQTDRKRSVISVENQFVKMTPQALAVQAAVVVMKVAKILAVATIEDKSERKCLEYSVEGIRIVANKLMNKIMAAMLMNQHAITTFRVQLAKAVTPLLLLTISSSHSLLTKTTCLMQLAQIQLLKIVQIKLLKITQKPIKAYRVHHQLYLQN